MAQSTPSLRIPPVGWLLMAGLALIWGGSFVANRQALTGLPVLTIVALRVAGGATALWLWVLIKGLPVPKGGKWLVTCAVLGLLNNVVPFCLIVWGQTQIPSGLAGILNASTAVFAVLVAAAVFPDERLTPARALGVALGLAGVIVAVGPKALAAFDLRSTAQLACLGAAVSYAVAGAFARNALKGIRPEVGAAGMLTAAAVVLLPAALLNDGLPPALPALPVLASLAYLSLVASALAYILFYAVLRLAGAGNLGLVTLLVAPVAIVLGVLIFGERLSPGALAGFGLIALGLLVMDGRIPLPGRRFSA
ncbi:DMT family transporter [Fuscibacter oryzae]|uniref:DMT family transporter n=1 Tax=Fuscibacter oryzae TaxID=2803939 RepID=A0A8J7SUG6_9RHOB|nr:DMT family transporter [Fuscibacter oryzae]MBL4927601.1 DMT family transporter [Fuscibacter oryzae]